MQSVIGVCGRKGGSGKTTVAVHIAAEMSSRGRKVALVDTDPQGSARHWAEPGELPMPVIHKPIQDNREIRAWSRALREIQADILVIDSAPHLDTGMGATVGLSDVVALPCGPSGLDLLALGETLGLVRQIREARGDGGPEITIVPTRVDSRTVSGRQLVDALRDLGETVAPTLHHRTALADAFNVGGWVGSFAPHSDAHEEIRVLTDHILKLIRSGRRKA